MEEEGEDEIPRNFTLTVVYVTFKRTQILFFCIHVHRYIEMAPWGETPLCCIQLLMESKW